MVGAEAGLKHWALGHKIKELEILKFPSSFDVGDIMPACAKLEKMQERR